MPRNLNHNIKKRQKEVKLEIEAINSSAQEKIKKLQLLAQEKLNEQSIKKELLTKTKIDQITRDANIEIQQNITQTSLEATISILEKKLNNEEKQNLINQSIKDLNSALKN